MKADPLKERTSEAVKEVAQPLMMPTLRFGWEWLKWSRPWLVGLCLIILAYGYMKEVRDRQILFCFGPRGGDGANQASVLQEQFDNRSWFRTNYFMTPVYTNGYVESHNRVNADKKGQIVGYAMDGYPDQRNANVQTILPMEWEYLHFLYNVKWLDDAGIKPEALVDESGKSAELGTVYLFSDWAAKVRKQVKEAERDRKKAKLPNLYLGPRESGTRCVAEAVLRHEKIPPEEMEVTGIGDFQDMLVALRRGDIDGAFYVGPRGASSIEKAAQDLKCTLISFDNAERLAKTYPFLEAGTIPTGIYDFRNHQELGEIRTPAIRCVLIASKWMPAGDAYRIASQVQQALPHRVAKIDSKMEYLAPDDDLASIDLNFPRHAGMWSGLEGSAPLDWVDRHAYWLAPLALTLLAGLIATWKGPIAAGLNRHLPPTAHRRPDAEVHVAEEGIPAGPKEGPAAESPKFAEIKKEVETVLGKMYEEAEKYESTATTPVKSDLRIWPRRISHIDRHIYAAERAAQLTHDQAKELNEDVARLMQKFDFLFDYHLKDEDFSHMPSNDATDSEGNNPVEKSESSDDAND